MQPPKSDICVMCGIRSATTKDHIPPKCFFRGFDGNLLTAPACFECNNKASANDADMRFYMSAQAGKKTPQTASLWEKHSLPHVNRKAPLRQKVVAGAHEVLTKDTSGNFSYRLGVEVPEALYDSVFGRTTRGLYFLHTGQILGPDTPIQVIPLERSPTLDFEHFESQEVGGGAFRYWYGMSAEEPSSTLWLYCFYDECWVKVCTGSLTEDQ